MSLGIVVFVIVIVLSKVIPLCLNSGSAAAVQGVTDDVLKLAKVSACVPAGGLCLMYRLSLMY